MKQVYKMIAALGLIASVSACTTVETTSRATTVDAPLGKTATAQDPILVAPDFNVAQINVIVPRTLTVSEANTYKPNADIVWRGDPYGDRYEQVKAVIESGLAAGASGVHGTRDVILDVEVAQFHAQTEKVRYTFGGAHEIVFALTVRDAQSGAVIIPSHLVDATFAALGGKAAVNAERAGVTQKVRIVNRLAEIISQQLSQPIQL